LPFGRPAIARVRASIVRETRELPGHERRLAREPTAADQHGQPLLGDDRILQLSRTLPASVSQVPGRSGIRVSSGASNLCSSSRSTVSVATNFLYPVTRQRNLGGERVKVA